MTNAEIAKVLERLAVMLELEGAAPRPVPTALARQATFDFATERPAPRK